MPIVRWAGWCAKCRKCGSEVVLLDGVIALSEREHVKDSLGIEEGETIEEAITTNCGCQKKNT